MIRKATVTFNGETETVSIEHFRHMLKALAQEIIDSIDELGDANDTQASSLRFEINAPLQGSLVLEYSQKENTTQRKFKLDERVYNPNYGWGKIDSFLEEGVYLVQFDKYPNLYQTAPFSLAENHLQKL